MKFQEWEPVTAEIGESMVDLKLLLSEFSKWFQNSHKPAAAEGSMVVQKLSEFPKRDQAFERRLSSVLFDPSWYVANNKRLSRQDKTAGIATLRQYFEVGCSEGKDPTSWFSEQFYRTAYPDVRIELTQGIWQCGYHHYLVRGLDEHRSPNPEFNELAYLGSHEDILDGLRAGIVPNGFFHYVCLGLSEDRKINSFKIPPLLELPASPRIGTIEPSTTFAETLYLAANPDIKSDGNPSPGLRHWLTHGLKEDLSGRRARLNGYVENVYLRLNPVLAEFVSSGNQPSGYHHFLMYGAAEGREWAGSLWKKNESALLGRALVTRTSANTLSSLPIISVIVPVYNPDPSMLRMCIDSVVNQTYPSWELCLADDGSYRPDTLEIMLDAGRADPRIKVTINEYNKGISAASNSALKSATGDFVALLDHDDILAPDALLHVMAAFYSKSDVDLVYTDEGKISESGELIDINPKPDWSPELLLSTMYIGHLTAYRRLAIEKVGGFRSSFDGTQDYDLALRIAEIARSVIHVPLPLYFWRMSPASTAGSMGAKPGILDVQRRALESAMLRRGLSGVVNPGHGAGHWAVVIDPPKEIPLVSIVIPTAGRTLLFNGQHVDLLVNLIHSITKTETYTNYEIVVVHNNDLSAATLIGLSSFERVRFIAFTYSRFNLSEKINLGVESAKGKLVLLLNDDMQLNTSGLITSMIGCMSESVGVVGAKLLYPNGTLQHAGVVWTEEGPTHAMIGEQQLIQGPSARLINIHNCLAVSGACMLFRRDQFLAIGGFSSRLPLNYNDVDLCLKMGKQGLRIVLNPHAALFHFESVSKSGTHFWELQLLCAVNPGLIDPFYNPTFSGQSPFYELKQCNERQTYLSWLIQRMDRRASVVPSTATIKFSIIMSVYQNKKHQMEELEETIINQLYPNWEWIITDDGSTLPETVEWLSDVKRHVNVKVIKSDKNAGIMAGYGRAFRASTGDYVVPVDADDFITIDCLQIMAEAIEREGFPDVVYSDEDKSTERGVIHSPFLKPDWDPVLFLNICYICHVCCIRRLSAESAGCYTDPDATWCHDWDSLLRLARAGCRIVHVPEVLYSWRIHPGSTASIETGNKPQTISSQFHVLNQHLQLTGLKRAFETVHNEKFPHDGVWRLGCRPEEVPRTAILVIAADPPGGLASILEMLSRTICRAGIIIVGAGDQARSEVNQLLPELKGLLFINGVEESFQNLSLRDAATLCAERYDVVGVIHPGIRTLNRDWVLEGAGMFGFGEVGAVCGEVLLPDGKVAWRGGHYGFGGMAGSPDYGRSQTDSGYHGIGWCQHSCDSVPSVAFFARSDLFAMAIKDSPETALTPGVIAGRVSETALKMRLRVIYTPFVQATLSRNISIVPVLQHMVERPAAFHSQYYHGDFGRELKSAYLLQRSSTAQDKTL